MVPASRYILDKINFVAEEWNKKITEIAGRN
jgi:hypothetical protein